jgi:hypothetical protein
LIIEDVHVFGFFNPVKPEIVRAVEDFVDFIDNVKPPLPELIWGWELGDVDGSCQVSLWVFASTTAAAAAGTAGRIAGSVTVVAVSATSAAIISAPATSTTIVGVGRWARRWWVLTTGVAKWKPGKAWWRSAGRTSKESGWIAGWWRDPERLLVWWKSPRKGCMVGAAKSGEC